MKQLLIGLFATLFGLTMHAQNATTASIDQLCAQQKLFLNSGNYARANTLADSAIFLSQAIKYSKGLSFSNRTKGYYAMFTGDTANARLFFQKSLQIAEQNNDMLNKGLALGSLAFYWQLQENLYAAQANLIKAREVFMILNDKDHLSTVAGNEAAIQILLGNTIDGLNKSLEALSLAKETDNIPQQILSNANAAKALVLLREPDSALTFIKAAKKLSAAPNMKGYRLLVHVNAADVYAQLGRYDEAYSELDEASSILKSSEQIRNTQLFNPYGGASLELLDFNYAYYLVMQGNKQEASRRIDLLTANSNVAGRFDMTFRIKYLRFLIAFQEKDSVLINATATELCKMAELSDDFFEINVCAAVDYYKYHYQHSDWREITKLDSLFKLVDARVGSRLREKAILAENTYKYNLELNQKEYAKALALQRNMFLTFENGALTEATRRQKDSIETQTALINTRDSLNALLETKNESLKVIADSERKKNILIKWIYGLTILFLMLVIGLVYRLRLQKQLRAEQVSKLSLFNASLPSHFVSRYLTKMTSADIPSDLRNTLNKLERLYGQMFRVTSNDTVTLYDEVQMGIDYLELEQLAISDEIKFDIKQDPSDLDARNVLLRQPLALHTLLINSIAHGKPTFSAHRIIEIEILVAADYTQFIVRNNGPEFNLQKLNDIYNGKLKRTSGLSVLYNRLKRIKFNSKPPHLITAKNQNGFTEVSIIVPSKVNIHYAV